MDIVPQVDGHTLVVPKAQAENLLGVEADALAKNIKAVETVAAAVKAAFDAPGIMIARLNGAAAGALGERPHSGRLRQTVSVEP